MWILDAIRKCWEMEKSMRQMRKILKNFPSRKPTTEDFAKYGIDPNFLKKQRKQPEIMQVPYEMVISENIHEFGTEEFRRKYEKTIKNTKRS